LIKYSALLVLLISFSLTCGESVSIPHDFKGTLIINEIIFEGNTKTREATLLFLLHLKPGDRLGSSDIEQAIQSLKNSELFRSLSWEVQKNDGKTRLIVRLQEKWTTIPILLFKADDSVSQLYAGLVDFNFLGMNAYARASYKGSKPSNASFFEDLNNEWVLEFDMPSLFSSPYGGGFYFETSEEDRSISKDSSDLESYTLNLTTLGLGLSRQLSGDITLNVEAVYADKSSGFDNGSAFEQKQLGLFAESHLNKTAVSDFRLTGSDIKAKAGFHQVFCGQGDSYFTFHSEALYRFIWPLASVYTTVKAQYDVSTSDDLINQPDLEAYLRGGSGRTYFDRQLAGFSTELSWTASFSDTFNLEFMAVADFAFTSDRPFQGDDLTFYYRAGPALRLSSPYIAGVNLNANLVITEEGKPEVYVGMMSFL